MRLATKRPNSPLGARLQRIRERAGFSLRTVEFLTDIAHVALYEWESGDRLLCPTRQELNCIIRAYREIPGVGLTAADEAALKTEWLDRRADVAQKKAERKIAKIQTALRQELQLIEGVRGLLDRGLQ